MTRPAMRTRISGDELFGGLGAVAGEDAGDGVGELETLAVAPVAEGFDFANAREALFEQVVFEGQIELLRGNKLL